MGINNIAQNTAKDTIFESTHKTRVCAVIKAKTGQKVARKIFAPLGAF